MACCPSRLGKHRLDAQPGLALIPTTVCREEFLILGWGKESRLWNLLHTQSRAMKALIPGFFAMLTLSGAAGFATPPSTHRAKPCSPLFLSPLRTCIDGGGLRARSRVHLLESTLRMVDDGAGDGGSNDGATLAEARIVVHGQTSGGFFRAHARNEAYFNRKLCGALKELGNGETEIIVEGKTSAIRSFFKWCRRGPGLSQRINDVNIYWAEYTGIFDGFEVFPEVGGSNSS